VRRAVSAIKVSTPEQRFASEESVNVPDVLQESKLSSRSGLAFSPGIPSQSSPSNVVVGSAS
jgi:hypothetical protein